MITISVITIKCFVITLVIIFSCLSSVASISNDIHSVNRTDDSALASSKGRSIGANRYPIAARITSESVDKGSCITKSDCHSNHSYCDTQTHRCKCNSDYININSFVNSHTNPSVPTCLPVAKLNDKCQSQEQCLVTNSHCVIIDQGMSSGYGRNNSRHHCICKEGYHQEDRDEVINRENQRITNNPICGEFVSMGNSWIGTFAIVCIMLLVILIGCFVGILRFQRWKQRPMQSTVTSLAQATGHTTHHMSSSPPPMGSVEAEFQNDFIQVFPMHHLEPLPDKNTSHEYVIK